MCHDVLRNLETCNPAFPSSHLSEKNDAGDGYIDSATPFHALKG